MRFTNDNEKAGKKETALHTNSVEVQRQAPAWYFRAVTSIIERSTKRNNV